MSTTFNLFRLRIYSHQFIKTAMFIGRLYAMQRGMEIDKKSPECRTYLVTLMDYLEKVFLIEAFFSFNCSQISFR